MRDGLEADTMRILHVTGHSLVRLTPARVAAMWGRYTPHEGRAVAIDRPGGPGAHAEFLNPYGLLCAGKGKHAAELKALFEWADVVHCHDDAHPVQWLPKVARKKALVYQAHIGDVPERFFSPRRKVFEYLPEVGHACITNGYGRFFDEAEKEGAKRRAIWWRLADPVDIWHPVLMPCPELRPRGMFRVSFAYSNLRERGEKVNAKCPKATRALLEKIPGVEVRYSYRQPFDECLAERKAAHVVVDDVFSPFTHLGALEGASVATCVLTLFDDYTVRELCEFVGAPVGSYPFLNVDAKGLRAKIEHLRDHPAEAVEAGRAARAWMEKYYDPRTILGRYEEFYSAVGSGAHRGYPEAQGPGRHSPLPARKGPAGGGASDRRGEEGGTRG